MLYTTTQAAQEIADGLSVDGRRPAVHVDKIKTLVKANKLTNLSGNSRIMIDRNEIEAFIRNTRYVQAAELLDLHPLVYRVSVLERQHAPSLAFDDSGALLRRQRGVDFSANPANPTELGGWEGVWPITQVKAAELESENGLLLASARGYVGPGHVRPVKSRSSCSPRWYFHTGPPSRDVEKFVGTGLWIDVPDGPISDFIKHP